MALRVPLGEAPWGECVPAGFPPLAGAGTASTGGDRALQPTGGQGGRAMHGSCASASGYSSGEPEVKDIAGLIHGALSKSTMVGIATPQKYKLQEISTLFSPPEEQGSLFCLKISLWFWDVLISMSDSLQPHGL